jgi:hypothetical protein
MGQSSVASRNIGAVATLLGTEDSLENLCTQTFDDGCLAYVQAEHKHYELHKDSTAASDPPFVIVPICGMGRWVPATTVIGAEGPQGFQGAQGAQGATGAPGSSAPFRATYYVDPTFGGVELGSQSSPFTTVAAAFAAGTALGIVDGIVFVPPGPMSEDIVFPPSGSWELSSTVQGQTQRTQLTGTVTLDSTAQAFHSISNIVLLGNVTGDKANANTNRLFFRNVEINTNLTLTSSGTGNWLVYFDGTIPVPSNATGLLAGIFGTCSIAGSLFASGCNLENVITVSSDSAFRNVFFNNNQHGTLVATTGAGLVNLTFTGCAQKNPATITATTGSVVAVFDSFSWAAACSTGLGLIAGTACTFKTLASNQSSSTTDTNNRASTALGGRSPDGLYEIVYDATLLGNGGGASGLLQLNAIYTDMTGTLVTVPVGTPLNVAAAVGSKSSGSLPFHHSGAAAPIAFSTTGVTAPGAMSVALTVTLRRVN